MSASCPNLANNEKETKRIFGKLTPDKNTVTILDGDRQFRLGIDDREEMSENFELLKVIIKEHIDVCQCLK